MTWYLISDNNTNLRKEIENKNAATIKIKTDLKSQAPLDKNKSDLQGKKMHCAEKIREQEIQKYANNITEQETGIY